MALSTTPIPPMHADWTASGGCISGLTAHPGDVTKPASGGAATTSTTSREGCHGYRRFPASLLRRLNTALRGQCGADDRLVPVDVRGGAYAEAWWMDDVDGVDADA